MRRALILIITLSLLSFGGGAALDTLQRRTAQQYLQRLDSLRTLIVQENLREAENREMQLRARWQHDARWLNCMISHHHTRDVSSALLHLATALEMGWQKEALLAADEAVDALEEIQDADFLAWENIL